jgi:DNA ligase-1
MNLNTELQVTTTDFSLATLDDKPNYLSDFRQFAELCDNIRLAPRKAAKSLLIADYLTGLHTDELVVATRILSGYVFPLRDHKKLNISGLVILNCLAACAGVPSSFVKERLCELGSLGDLAYEIFTAGLTIAISNTLLLGSTVEATSQLSAIPGTRKKSEIITHLLRRATPLEAKYLVEIMTGDLNIGLSESDVEHALSSWKDISIGRIQSANMLLGDIGETAVLCAEGRIDEARMRLFRPIKYMLATELTRSDNLQKLLPEPMVVEDYTDAIRVQVHIGLDVAGNADVGGSVYDGLRVLILSDRLEDITGQFLDLVPGISGLLYEQAGTVEAVGVIFDGVIVATRNGVILPMAELKVRLVSYSAGDVPAVDIPVGFVVFDQLFGEGRSLIQEEWYDRRISLEKIGCDNITTFRTASSIISGIREFEAAVADASRRGVGEVLIKNPRSSYRPGRRGRDWFRFVTQDAATAD